MNTAKSVAATSKKKVEMEAKRTELDDQEEIEKIMNEIDQLEAKMNPRPPLAEKSPPEEQVTKSNEEVEISKSSENLSNPESLPEDDLMSDFRANSQEEGGMEETLGMVDEDESDMNLQQSRKNHEKKHLGLIDLAMNTSEQTPDELPNELPNDLDDVTDSTQEKDENENEMNYAKDESEERQMELPKPNNNQEGSLAISLIGNMTLKLKYEYVGKEVLVSFDDQVLKVALTDGSEFKIPLGAPSQSVEPQRGQLRRVS